MKLRARQSAFVGQTENNQRLVRQQAVQTATLNREARERRPDGLSTKSGRKIKMSAFSTTSGRFAACRTNKIFSAPELDGNLASHRNAKKPEWVLYAVSLSAVTSLQNRAGSSRENPEGRAARVFAELTGAKPEWQCYTEGTGKEKVPEPASGMTTHRA